MAATTTSGTSQPRRAKRPLGGQVFPFYGCLTLIALVFIGPYLIAFFGAFKSEANLFATSPWAPPHSLYLGNFRTVLFGTISSSTSEIRPWSPSR